jgi:dienelactone hydrolase
MSQPTQRHEMAMKKVVYEAPGAEAVTVRRDVEYRVDESGPSTMDLYLPPGAESGARLPAVLFVIGYSDLGAQRLLGCRFKEMESYISWGRLVAASGMVGITYSTGQDPAADVDAVLRSIRENAAALGIDENRIGLWASSGNGPVALSVLMQEGKDRLACAALCYGVTLDLDGATGVAEAAAMFRFANPSAGKSVEDLPQELPLLLVRAGRDETPRLNEALDRFVAKALAANLPFTLVNHATAPHAFDILEESETSREVIRRVLSFLRFHLHPAS